MRSASKTQNEPDAAVRFSTEEINIARRLRDEGLAWTPTVGHYVYDERGTIKPGSPFQDRVYFILNMKQYLNRLGSIENMRSALLWLPTWRQARQLAHTLGIAVNSITEMLRDTRALDTHDELLALYGLISEALSQRPAPCTLAAPSGVTHST